MELMGCQNLAVPKEVMHHVVQVESSYNPYAIGVVGGRLVRQPKNVGEALATARMLESRGYNFSLGLAQVNRYNLAKYGLTSYEKAFETCPNLQAGSRILAECYNRSGADWGKSFSCYYSGNFVTGYRQGYVQKVYASMRSAAAKQGAEAIAVVDAKPARGAVKPQVKTTSVTRSPALRRAVATDISRTASSASRAFVPTTIPTQVVMTPTSSPELAQAVAAPVATGPVVVTAVASGGAIQSPQSVTVAPAATTPVVTPGSGADEAFVF